MHLAYSKRSIDVSYYYYYNTIHLPQVLLCIHHKSANHRHCPLFTLSLLAPFQLASSFSFSDLSNLLWSGKALQ